MDETPVQVLKEPGKRAQSTSYLWLQRGGPPDQPIILYDYDPGRGAGVPMRLLEGFRGYLQTDGDDGYNARQWPATTLCMWVVWRMHDESSATR